MFEVALALVRELRSFCRKELLGLHFLSLSRPFYLVHRKQALDAWRVRHPHFGRIGRHETAVASFSA